MHCNDAAGAIARLDDMEIRAVLDFLLGDPLLRPAPDAPHLQQLQGAGDLSGKNVHRPGDQPGGL